MSDAAPVGAGFKLATATVVGVVAIFGFLGLQMSLSNSEQRITCLENPGTMHLEGEPGFWTTSSPLLCVENDR